MIAIEPQILQGHVIDVLRTLPDESVQLCLTSPPYFGLRAYGTQPQVWGGNPDCEHEWAEREQSLSLGGYSEKSTLAGFTSPDTKGAGNGTTVLLHAPAFCIRCGAWRGELGSEPTPELFIEHLVEVFREVRRVLRKDGLLFVNIGDSYAGSNKGVMSDGSIVGGPKQKTNKGTQLGSITKTGTPEGCKPKDLIGVPWMLAFALRADGWYLRSDIIWEKPNAMPESVTDRPTKSHEYIFQLAKSREYFYDQDAIRESVVSPERTREKNNGESAVDTKMRGFGSHCGTYEVGRNKRSVWSINTQPYSEAHFATWPEELAETIIKCGSSEHGCCPKCGAPWKRVVEKPDFSSQPKRNQNKLEGQRLSKGDNYMTSAGQAWQDWRNANPDVLLGWEPSCKCGISESEPCTVLDPFGGSGTSGLVATRLGRKSILIELNPEYAAMAQRRTAQLGMSLF